MIKQVIVMRSDLNMRRGKEIAQGAHASMKFLTEQLNGQILTQRMDPEVDMSGFLPAIHPPTGLHRVHLSIEQEWWIINGFKKVTCRVRSEDELMALYEAARASSLPVHVVEDEGLTEFGGILTKTCLAIGPAHQDLIDPITGHLELY